jgi:hypothetical protein
MNIQNIERRSRQSLIEKINEHLKKIEDKTKMKRKNFLTLLSLFMVLIWIGIFEIYISYLITIYYPIIWSIREIEDKELEGDKQWLTYWVCFSIFVYIDMFIPFVIVILPFYFVIRTVFLLWLLLPNFKGGVVLYNIILVQLLKMSQNFKFKFIKTNSNNSLLREVEEIVKERNHSNTEKEVVVSNDNYNDIKAKTSSSSILNIDKKNN